MRIVAAISVAFVVLVGAVALTAGGSSTGENKIRSGVFVKLDGVVAGTPESFKPNLLGVFEGTGSYDPGRLAFDPGKLGLTVDCERPNFEEVLDGYNLDRDGNTLVPTTGLSGFSGLLELHDSIHDLKSGGLTIGNLRHRLALLDRIDNVIEKCSMATNYGD